MDIKANANFVRMSPKKIRLIADLVRGLDVKKALNQISFSNKKAGLPVEKLLKSAIANAEHNYELDKNNLFVKEIKVNEAPMLHRFTPKAHGRAGAIRKRSSHINIVLGELKDGGVKEAKKREVEAPISLADLAKKGESVSKDNKGLQEDGKKERSNKGGAEGAGKKGFVSNMFNRKSGGK